MKKEYVIQPILFLIGILFISYSYWIGGCFVLFIFLLLSVLQKETLLLNVSILTFLVGFILYQYLSLELRYLVANNYLRILVNRGLLIIIILGYLAISCIYDIPLFKGFSKPLWSNKIISIGLHSVKVSYFLVQAILINVFIFIPFIFKHKSHFTGSLIMFAVLFSLLNGILEEVIWRGILLDCFRDSLNSTMYAVILTSIGFGLQHISLGFSLSSSILFSFGGIWFAIVAVRSDSIYPSIIWHSIINVGMVLSGLIV